jgi:hypothetical protein
MRLSLLLCVLVLSGCGVLDDPGPATHNAPDPAVYGPSRTTGDTSPSEIPRPPVRTVPAGVARQLDAGAVGVVDVTGAVGVRPSSLDTASDVTLVDVEWTAWGAAGASGRGTLRMQTCQPSCAVGGTRDVPASVTLSDVVTCSGRRYFGRGVVTLAPSDAPRGLQPATYLRAPC